MSVVKIIFYKIIEMTSNGTLTTGNKLSTGNTLNSPDLIAEATKYLELRNAQGKNWVREVDKVYIIDKLWVKMWKQYVNLDSIKKKKNSPSESETKTKKEKENSIKDKENLAKLHPGEITNQRIIYNLKEFYNDGNAKNSENIVVRHDIDQQKSIKIIHSDTWKFFRSLYGGGPEIISPIIDEKIRNSSYMRRYIELYLSKFNICFLPRKSELSESVIEKITFRPTYISKRRNISDLKDKLIRICMSLSANSRSNPTSQLNIRLWKVNPGNNLEDLRKLLLTIKKEGKAVQSDMLSYMECINILFIFRYRFQT